MELKPIDKDKIKVVKDEESLGKEWFDIEYEKSLINLDEEIERPETLISIGEHTFNGKSYPVDVMTAGEYSAISAPSKNKKSFIKSQFVAAYIGGNAQDNFPNIKGHRKNEDFIIDVDTEQSKYYASRTFKRVEKITGQRYKNYFPFKLRHLTPDERVGFVDNLLKSPKFRGKVKMVFIDGIADLIEDTNDLVSSNYIVGKLLQWTDIYNIHVCVIIHNAYGMKKPTGHLGTATLKKAESVIFLQNDENNKDIVHVSQDYSRGMQFEDFCFKISKDALPVLCDQFGNVSGKPTVIQEPERPKPHTPTMNDWDIMNEDDENDVPF